MSRESEYWAGRFAQLEEASHRDAGETMAFIDEAYRRAEGEVEKQLDRWYQRFADNNGIVDMAAARQLLHSGELKEFRWTLEEYAQRARETGHGAD